MSTRSGRIRVIAPEESPSRTRKLLSPPWAKNSDKSRKRSKSAGLRFRKSPSPKPPCRKSATNFQTRKSPSRTSKENAENAPQSPAGHLPIKSEPKVLLYDILQTPYFIKNLSSSVTQSKIPIESKLNEVDWVNSNNDLLRKKPAITQRRSRLSDHFGLLDVTYNIPESRSGHSRSASKSISGSIHTFHDGDNSDGESHDVTNDIPESRLSHSRSARKLRSISVYNFHVGDNCDGELQREPSRSHTLITSFKESFNNVLFNKWYSGKRLGSVTLMLLISLTVFAILVSCTKLCSDTAFFDPTVYKNILLLIYRALHLHYIALLSVSFMKDRKLFAMMVFVCYVSLLLTSFCPWDFPQSTEQICTSLLILILYESYHFCCKLQSRC